MNEKQIKRISKNMSLVLRHQPEVFNLQLDDQGWCEVDHLLQGFHNKGITVTREQLNVVVRENNKQRFTFNEDGTKIRANQGHSLKIELGYETIQPPEFLFHGTARKNLESIQKTGLTKRQRHHVHLSAEKDTAINVGQRHGKPVVLIVKSGEMFNQGISFFKSKNDVWLTEEVPPHFIDFPS